MLFYIQTFLRFRKYFIHILKQISKIKFLNYRQEILYYIFLKYNKYLEIVLVQIILEKKYNFYLLLKCEEVLR